jgi:hypothetical protein
MTVRRELSCVATVVCLILAGCHNEPPGAIVRGSVTYKNAPLDRGTVMFYPNGSGQASYGNVQKDGKFQLMNPHKTERIEPGKYVAVVLAGNSEIAAAKEDPLYPVQPAVPFKFSSVTTSPLKYDIVLGENNLEINLDTL